MEKIRSYIPIIGVLGFALGLYLTGDAIWTYSTYEPVEGVVSGIGEVSERRGRRGRRIREVEVEISYTAKGEAIQIQKSYSEGDEPALNTKLPMRYKPSDPYKAVIDNPAADFGLGLGSFIVGSVCLFLTIRGWGSE